MAQRRKSMAEFACLMSCVLENHQFERFPSKVRYASDGRQIHHTKKTRFCQNAETGSAEFQSASLRLEIGRVLRSNFVCAEYILHRELNQFKASYAR